MAVTQVERCAWYVCTKLHIPSPYKGPKPCTHIHLLEGEERAKDGRRDPRGGPFGIVVVQLSQKAAQAMRKTGGGKIINISSVHDWLPLRNRSIYSISKGGLMMLTKSLAFELAEHNIHVTAISPGAILTDMNRESLSRPENLSRVLGTIAVKRLGTAEDIVGAVVFLASPESDYVTGATLYVDGGMLLY